MKIKVIYLILITCCCFLFACEEAPTELSEITDNSSLEEDDQLLSQLYNEIFDLASKYDCSDPSDWSYTPIGSKACGGPFGYIAYSNQLNEQEFLNLVIHYTKQQEIYNTKWGIGSDCSLITQPTGIECVDGVAKLIY
ncbi:MAG: hypothetical protein JXQ90_14020 [Cyclobacteriaceae bacterium]